MKLARRALAAVAAVALVSVPATAASAQTVLHLDRTHDVRSVDASSAATSTTYTRETRVPAGDVLSIRITHGPRNVTVTVKFRELAKGGPPTVHDVYFRTDARTRRAVSVIAVPGAWYGHQQMTTLPANGSDGTTVRCARMRHAIDYVRNKVTLTVPRSCLGNPGWVQVAEDTTRIVDNSDTTGALKVYADDAFSPYLSDFFHWSPRVHRG